MKKLCVILPMILLITGCAGTNPLLAVTGGKSLKEIAKVGYKNPYLRQLKGVHISELQSRGVKLQYDKYQNRYVLNEFMYQTGSGVETYTYTTYASGDTHLTNIHIDGKTYYGKAWFEVDNDGFITDYVEIGDSVLDLSSILKPALADLL